MSTTIDFLKQLIGFPTVSAESNRVLIDYCADILSHAGADVSIIESNTENKANLYATLGPRNVPGVLLSGHTDVVPVEGQTWTVPPFEMTQHEDKLFGRGTTDMKGFIASALAAAELAATRRLKTPLHFAFSYDEEIGCVGVHSMIDMLEAAPFRPLMCIVGEPTLMTVATGHKGKTGCKVTCTGREGHSALAPDALNAIYMACDLISFIRKLQEEVAISEIRDEDYDVPYTTLHVGNIEGGVALNIVPNHAGFKFEIRNLIEDDPQILLQRIQDYSEKLLKSLRPQFPEADIEISVFNTYPPLSTAKDADIVNFVKSLSGSNATIKVAFGTEGGLFSSKLGIPTVICGPGSMAQGHKPDEFIASNQLAKCDAMLAALVDRLEVGL
ncbi:MAG: acetylornithine deacetylase [Pseudomonadota bacterium]